MNTKDQLNELLLTTSILSKDGLYLAQQITKIIDELIIRIFSDIEKNFPNREGVFTNKGLTVIAIGGYGRRELTSYSDIDIMLLAERRDNLTEKLATAFLYALWDRGLNISHSFRTLSECLEDAMKDITIRTALIDSRFLAGDKILYEIYRADIYQKIIFRKKLSFISAIMTEAYNRHKKSGDSTYLLEPNIKEGKGALRDIHSIRWLAKTSFRINNLTDLSKILTKKDYISLIKAYDFFVKIRICLHSLSKRRNDILSFEFQSSVAKMISIKGTSKHHAAEILMRLYYKKASQVSQILNTIKHLCYTQHIKPLQNFSVKKISANFFLSNNEIIIKNHRILKSSDNILEAFYLFSITGKKFSHQLKCAINNKNFYVKKNEPSKIANHYFIKILQGNRVYETLRLMHESVVLDRFIPEFGRLRHLVIYEPYHKYTVDEHTLIAIKNLEELKYTKNQKSNFLKEIFTTIKQEVLFLAILLHDIGKGFHPNMNKKHEEMSYKIIKNILERFNLPTIDSRKVEFLVRNHIILSKLAFTRDTDAPETITSLCEIIESEENLHYLLLMTYADMTAVSPTFWTEWKSYLLYDLMNKAKKHLNGILLQSIVVDDDEIKNYLNDMPVRYSISNTIDDIKEDFKLVNNIANKNISIKIKEKTDGTAEIIIATFDVLGLFARIVKIFKSKGFNIIRARLYTSKTGLVLDKILISNWKDLWWEGLCEDLIIALEKGIFKKLEDTPAQEMHSKSFEKFKNKTIEVFQRYEYFIEIDNDASTEYTIMEISSPDRIGLLYDISIQLYLNKVDIISAIINTEQNIAQDIFYLQHDDGKLNSDSIFKILNSLYSVLFIKKSE